ncbi:MAG: YcgL domain-containing protein [Pseudomonadales bacterium]
MTVVCDVFKSTKHADMYLYVRQEDGLSRVPEELIDQFGSTEMALSFELRLDRKLARVDAGKVLANLEEHGYHLQMPPPKYGPGLQPPAL